MRWMVLVTLTTAVLAALRPVRRRTWPRLPGSGRPGPLAQLLAVVGGRAVGEPNPFEVLRVQTRLGVIADEVRALERDQNVYARAHHLEATQHAYDALLAEACVLAGVATTPAPPGDEQERFREEVELASRGWSW